MLTSVFEPVVLIPVMAGAALAGFTTGFAGFGTVLVASGIWFHVLPAHAVPPLAVLAAVAAHVIGLSALPNSVDWRGTAPFLGGGIVAIPPGVALLSFSSPDLLRIVVGVFLLGYSAYQLVSRGRLRIGAWGGRIADVLVGAGGGFLGGFAGLSGPAPLIWLQLRGGPSAEQRAIYQPYNLAILLLAGLAMAVGGMLDRTVITLAVVIMPVTLIAAFVGARVYLGISEQAFKRAILVLLAASGLILLAYELG